jgi:hypothetical protein
MRAAKREIRASVVELIAAELDDVRVAPEVLGMAGAALEGSGVAHQPTVQAALRAEVGRNLLMACGAQLRLPAAITAVVAVCAVLLELRVRSGELPGHEQRLGIHGFSPRGDERTEQYDERP